MSRRHAGDTGPEVTLPITPMLDMSFQLLFFFMATFNPTDPEGAQILAMAREVGNREFRTVNPQAGKPNILPLAHNRGESEKLEIDTDLRLFIEVAGIGRQPILLKDGAVDIKSADTLQDADLLKALRAKLEERKSRAREDARTSGKSEDEEFAKQKVRIQTTMDVSWGEVFDAMNLCTRVGFKTVALSTPKDYVPRVPPNE